MRWAEKRRIQKAAKEQRLLQREREMQEELRRRQAQFEMEREQEVLKLEAKARVIKMQLKRALDQEKWDLKQEKSALKQKLCRHPGQQRHAHRSQQQRRHPSPLPPTRCKGSWTWPPALTNLLTFPSNIMMKREARNC